MAPLVIYITGFRQHAGKTVTSLGLLSLLRKHMDPIHLGYVKPVGQELVTLADGSKIDKDARIVQEFSSIPDLDMTKVSPVRVGSGFTKSFLSSDDSRSKTQNLENLIIDSMESLNHKKIIIAEGTGHPGVGSIVGLSNANVANLINADIVFLSGGGIGKALDMLEVDLSYFLFKRARVRGIIFNKLIPDKITTMKQFVTDDLLNNKYGAFGGALTILGFLPMIEVLSQPSMKIIHDHFKNAEAIGDIEEPSWEVPCDSIKVVSLPSELLNVKKHISPQSLVIIAANARRRINTICEYNRVLTESGYGIAGFLLTCGDCPAIDPETESEIRNSGIPAVYVEEDTATAEKIVLDAYENTKLQIYDKTKLKEVEYLFEQYFDFQKFIDTFGVKI
ncbi:MAG: AAA family ATPase [Spirochaetales bacterium]|nr:AAA family ATPase [Spirochaetales bacterium]